MGIRLFRENGSLSISPEDLILYYFFLHFLSVLKISKNLVFFLITSSEYLTKISGDMDKDPHTGRNIHEINS